MKGDVIVMDYFPTVVQVVPFDNYHVHVFFDDGKIIDYDMSCHLNGELFASLKDLNTFMSTCTVINGTLAWDLEGHRDTEKCIDIDPITLYDCPSINSQIA